MTSWLKLNVTKPIEKKNTLLFETTDLGFCSQFNQYLYAVLYAENEGIPLTVNDTANAVSIRFPIIRETFVKPSGIAFTDSQILLATSLKKRIPQMKEFLKDIRPESFRFIARELFQWNPSLLEKVENILSTSSVPSTYDIGVHIDSDSEMKAVPINKYIDEIKSYQTKEKKNKLQIVVMTDSPQKLLEFKVKKDPSWTIYSLGVPPFDFNTINSRTRINAYLNFIAELVLIQRAEHIVCSLLSNVGRFLYLTAEDSTSIASVDIPKFNPF
jgi:hypothetical protein